MNRKLEELEHSFEELERELSDPSIFDDQERYRRVTKSHSEIGEIVKVFRVFRKYQEELVESKELLKDSQADMREMVKEEITTLEAEIVRLGEELKVLLLPRDPMDEKNIILEIRAGTGGDEAALFVADLFRMYSRYAERVGWKVELMDANSTGVGGFKEVIASISGDRVFSKLKFESGTHRVQRVPATETQGRIHTSAATVAIMAEAEEVDIDIRPEDIRVDVFRASGPGGQSVNTTDSAIRITHLSSGLVVICQDEKSQLKNKLKALKVLRSRILQMEQDKVMLEQNTSRRSQVGSGDRSERIRTYNYPQGRLTDHRINITLYKLDQIMDGDLEDVVTPLVNYYQSEALKEQSGN